MAYSLLARRISGVLLSVMFLTLNGQNASTAQAPPNKLQSKYGVFIHYLSNDVDVKDSNNPQPPHPGGIGNSIWDKTVDSFKVDNFVKDIVRTGASYVVFTIGQDQQDETDQNGNVKGKGNFASPNSVLQKAAAIHYGKKEYETSGVVSQRDLVSEIIDALKKNNIDFYPYLPENNKYDVKNGDWLAPKVIEEYAARWGTKIDGWWIDGCYQREAAGRFGEAGIAKANTDTLINAAKSGNPNSLVFCNSEATTFRYWSENQGAIGGEENFFHRLPDPDQPFALGIAPNSKPEEELQQQFPDINKPLAFKGKPAPVQWHVTPPLGSNYGFQDLDRFKKVYPEGYLPRYIKKVTDFGGAVTVDMGITAEGKLFENQLKEMDKVRDHLGGIPLPTNANLALGKIAYLKRNEKPFATLQPEKINIPGFPVFAWPLFGNNGKVDEYYSKPDSKSYGDVAWNYMVDLEQASQFQQIQVSFLNDVSPSSYIVETSNDQEADGTIKWNLSQVTKAPTPTPGVPNTYTFEFQNVTARYVRLKAPDAQTGKQMAIKEFSVYNR